MTDRAATIAAFLAEAGWHDASRETLAGDASSRLYERLHRRDGGESAVLMEGGSGSRENVQRFAEIAGHLNTNGLSAPRILAADHDAGLLLLEDFGDDIFARLIDRDPGREAALYDAAIDVLVHLQELPPPTGLACPSPEELADFVTITQEWYGPSTGPAGTGTDLVSELTRLLTLIQTPRPVMSLRDYHSENMIWLPDRPGIRRVGLLDFQDAFICHPAYDLASLIRDARRDLSPGLAERLVDRYLHATGHDADALHLALAVIGVQRNLRILGVFARLCRQQGKPHYVRLIPRVWRHVMTDLDHPELHHLRGIIRRDLPEPTDDVLNRLKAECVPLPQA